MRSSGTMTVEREHNRALVVQPQQQGSLVIRNSDPAVIPPRPLTITIRAKRSFAKLAKLGILATACGFSGYAYNDPAIRRAIDYRFTLLTAPGVSSMSPTAAVAADSVEPLSSEARYLFASSQKGPRANRFSAALKVGSAMVSRRTKGDPLHLNSQPLAQTRHLPGRSCSCRPSRSTILCSTSRPLSRNRAAANGPGFLKMRACRRSSRKRYSAG